MEKQFFYIAAIIFLVLGLADLSKSFCIKISLKSYHEFGSAGLTYFGTHELQR